MREQKRRDHVDRGGEFEPVPRAVIVATERACVVDEDVEAIVFLRDPASELADLGQIGQVSGLEVHVGVAGVGNDVAHRLLTTARDVAAHEGDRRTQVQRARMRSRARCPMSPR